MKKRVGGKIRSIGRKRHRQRTCAASAHGGGKDVGRSADGAPAPGRSRSVIREDGLAGALIGANKIEESGSDLMKRHRITARSHVEFVQPLFRYFALGFDAINNDRCTAFLRSMGKEHAPRALVLHVTPLDDNRVSACQGTAMRVQVCLTMSPIRVSRLIGAISCASFSRFLDIRTYLDYTYMSAH